MQYTLSGKSVWKGVPLTHVHTFTSLTHTHTHIHSSNKATRRHLKNVYTSLALTTLAAGVGAFAFFVTAFHVSVCIVCVV